MSEESPISVVKFDSLVKIDSYFKVNPYKSFFEAISKSVCYNQKMIAQYHFILSQKHKKLKDLCSIHKSNLGKNEEIISSYRDLQDYSYNALKIIVKENFSFVMQCLHDRATEQPRVCLKLMNRGSIITAFRDRSSSIPEKKIDSFMNTALERICKGESHYLSNDIPSDAKSGLYVNARITNQEKVNSYIHNNPVNSLLSKIPGFNKHTNWRDCWERLDSGRKDLAELSPEVCYKSTLVIPLSLKRSELDHLFIMQFDNNNAPDENDAERMIFGFLCFDHQDIKFFEKSIDLKMGYIFADMISIYLITRKMYTDCSTTYNKVRLEISESS